MTNPGNSDQPWGLIAPAARGACKLTSVDVTSGIINLSASTEAKLSYDISIEEATSFIFSWPAWNVPNHITASVNTDVILDLGSEISVDETFISNDKYGTLRSRVKRTWKKEVLDTLRVDLGIIGSKSLVLITLNFIDQLQLDHSESLHGTKGPLLSIVHTIPSGLFHVLADSLAVGKDVRFNFEAFVNTPVGIDEIHIDPADLYSVKFLSNKRNHAQISPKKANPTSCPKQLQILLRGLPQLFAFSEAFSNSQNKAADIDCLAVNFVPNLSDFPSEVCPNTELVLLIDRSKRVTQPIMRCFSDVLHLFIKRLLPSFRFQVIGFGTLFETLFLSGSSEYCPSAVNRALRYRDGLKNDMGLPNLYPALRYAAEFASPGRKWQRQVIALLGGDIWDTCEVTQLLAANRCKFRTYLVAVGDSVNTTVLSTVGRAGQATVSHVVEEEQLYATMTRILNQAVQPRADHIEIHLDCPRQAEDLANVSILPRLIPPVHHGQYLTAMVVTPKNVLSRLKGKLHVDYSVLDMKQTISMDLKAAGCHLQKGKTQCSALHHLTKYFEQLEQHKCSEETVTLPSPTTMHKVIVQEEITPNVERSPIQHAAPPGKPEPKNKKVEKRSKSTPSRVCGCFPRRQKPQARDHSSPAPRTRNRSKLSPQAVPIANLIRVAELQEIDGSWALTVELIELLSVSFNRVLEQMPKIDITNLRQIWATALASGYIQLEAGTRKADWKLTIKKAEAWLLEQAQNRESNQTFMVTDMIDNAQSFISSEVKK